MTPSFPTRRSSDLVALIEGWRGLGIVDRSAKLDDRPGRPAEVGGVPGLRATVRHRLRAGGQATGEVAQPSRPVFVSARYRQAERHLGIRLLPGDADRLVICPEIGRAHV